MYASLAVKPQSLSARYRRRLAHNGSSSAFFLGAGKSEQQGNNELLTTNANLLAGHQIVSPTLKTRFFAAVDVKDRDFTMGGEDEGTNTGERVSVQLTEGRKSAIQFDIQGSYTTTHNAYNLLGRAGWPVGDMTVGPEAAITGSDHYTSTRVVVALSDWRLGSVNVTVRTGYAFGSDDAGGGDQPFFCAIGHTAILIAA